jgi:hypothetical protein
MDLSTVTESLVNNDYLYDAKEGVYYRPVADGSTDEVTVDEREGIVAVIRYNRNGVQTSYKEATVKSQSNIQQALNII